MMISATINLMVSDMVASLGFYCDVIGAELAFTVDNEHNTEMPGVVSDNVVIASLQAGSSEIMLQERNWMIANSPAFDASVTPGASSVLYLRCDDVDAVANKLAGTAAVLKPLASTWYGMREFWVRDPDGYIITVGAPQGPPPDVEGASALA